MVFEVFTNLYSNNDNIGQVENDPIQVSIDIESPPCILYGSVQESSGSILSGLLNINVRNPYRDIDCISTPDLSTTLTNLSLNSQHSITTASINHSYDNSSRLKTNQILSGYTKIKFNSITLSLIQNIIINKPFLLDSEKISKCLNCNIKKTVIKEWEIQNMSRDFQVGNYQFPFSYLLDGSLPASACLGSGAQIIINYELIATINYLDPCRNHDTFGEEQLCELSLPIIIKRAYTHHSMRTPVRVFPPTKMTASASLPSYVSPKSTFPLKLRIDGITQGNKRWKMRKLSWKIEEKTKFRGYVCSNHRYELKILEEMIRKRDEELKKKPKMEIKRYGTLTPQVNVTLCEGNMGNNNNNPEPVRSNRVGIVDDEGEEEEEEFFHPNDDAMREEMEETQERQRLEEIEQQKQSGSSIFTEEVRVLKQDEMKSGWKSDFHGEEGCISLMTDLDIMDLDSGLTNPIKFCSSSKPMYTPAIKPTGITPDIQDHSLGLYVTHNLSLEIVVAEEEIQIENGTDAKNPRKREVDQRLAEISPMFANRGNQRGRNVKGSRLVSVPTGAARVLTMQFKLPVCERSGLGISWEEEVPPMYQDIKLLSPPEYENVPEYSEVVDERYKLSHVLSPPPMARHSNRG